MFVRAAARLVLIAGCAASAAGFFGAGCAAPGPPPAESLPVFDDHEATLFDDGLDLVSDPEGVGGRWQEEWSRELDQRVARAETVAIGTVHTFRTDLDLERKTSYRLIFRVEEMLKGATTEGDLTLSSQEGSRGYASIERTRDALLDQRFVAFMSRFRNADGVVSTHWHLSPASEPVLRSVRGRVEAESPTFHEVRVIERRD